MYGQMTAGSWIYIGTQGILQGTYETFAAVAGKRFGGTLAGTLTLTAGLGGMGGAQPLAVTMNGGVASASTSTRPGSQRRIEHALPGRRGRPTSTRPSSCAVEAAKPSASRFSIGLLGNAAELFPELLRRGVPIDVVTDQTSRARPADATCPIGVDLERLATYADEKPDEFTAPRPRVHGQARARRWSASRTRAPRSSTTATRSAARRSSAATRGAFDFPGFVPAYIRPLFCEGKGPFRWAALSGDPKDIAATDQARPRPLPRERRAGAAGSRWRRARPLPGPAGADLLARLRRARQGRLALQRAGRRRRPSKRRSSSAATTSTAARWPRPTARPRPCSTARTPSPTGRC